MISEYKHTIWVLKKTQNVMPADDYNEEWLWFSQMDFYNI